MPDDGPKTLMEAVQHFASLDVCHAYMIRLKWPDGRIACPKCGGDEVGNIASRRMLQCKAKDCRKQFSAKVGTIFEDSPLPLPAWFCAVWCIANFKMGISSHELGRTLGITQKSAWFMLHRIRLAMTTQSFRKLSGVVESDETFVGGLAANMHAAVRARRIRGRGTVGKAIVHGLLERNSSKVAQDSEVRASVIPDTEAGTILALLKRAIKGTYVHCAPFHLFRYLDEEIFRFNKRRFDDGQRFALVMQAVLGKRITYRLLCSIDDAGFMGIS